MTRIFLTMTLSILSSIVNGQINIAELSKIKTLSQAETYIDSNPKANAEIFTLESSTDSAKSFIPLYSKKIGFTMRIDKYRYKILEIDSTLSFRVNYIFLSGDKYTKKQADSIRNQIIKEYNAGNDFLKLVRKYNMDGNITGDTHWFTTKRMVERFERAVRSHKKGEIFTVDTPEENWYHVVLKSFDDTYIKKVTVLKILSSH